MTKYICFSNPGEIDIDAAVTLGVNAKLAEHPIGYFGTGLKYAIAVLLRKGQAVRIRSGLREFLFETKVKTIRGEDFEMIVLREMLDPPPREGSRAGKKQLGFTTAFGRNWTVENAYRELWSNMTDEGGVVSEADRLPRASAGKTQIIIRGDEFASIHAARADFILSAKGLGEPLYADGNLAVYVGESNEVFYKGIAAAKAEKPYKYTYNILRDCTLTEDRTLQSWEVEYEIKRWAILNAPAEQVSEVISARPEAHAEGGFHYGVTMQTPSPAFRSAVRAAPASARNSTAWELVSKFDPEASMQAAQGLTDTEVAELEGALLRVESWGYDLVAVPVRVAESIYASDAWKGFFFDRKGVKLWLSREILADRDRLEPALIRGWLASRGLSEPSEARDSMLLTQVVVLGRRLEDAR